jgi:hypothetical protein
MARQVKDGPIGAMATRAGVGSDRLIGVVLSLREILDFIRGSGLLGSARNYLGERRRTLGLMTQMFDYT